MSVSRKILILFCVVLGFGMPAFSQITLDWSDLSGIKDCGDGNSSSFNGNIVIVTDIEGDPSACGPCTDPTVNNDCATGVGSCSDLSSVINSAPVDITPYSMVEISVSLSTAGDLEETCTAMDRLVGQVTLVRTDDSDELKDLFFIIGDRIDQNETIMIDNTCSEYRSFVVTLAGGTTSTEESFNVGFNFSTQMAPPTSLPAPENAGITVASTFVCPNENVTLSLDNCNTCQSITATPASGGFPETDPGNSVTFQIPSSASGVLDYQFEYNDGNGSCSPLSFNLSFDIIDNSIMPSLIVIDPICPTDDIDLKGISDNFGVDGTWTGGTFVTNNIFNEAAANLAEQQYIVSFSSTDCGVLNFNEAITVTSDQSLTLKNCSAAIVAADQPTGPKIGAPDQMLYCDGQSITLTTETFDSTCPTCLYEWVRQDVVIFSNSGDPTTTVQLIPDPSGTNTFTLDFTDENGDRTSITPPVVVPLFQLSGSLDTLICFGESLDLTEFLPTGVTGTWGPALQVSGNTFNTSGLATPNVYNLEFRPSFCPTTAYQKRVTILAGSTVTIPDITTECQNSGTVIDLTVSPYNIDVNSGQWDLDGSVPPQQINLNSLSVGTHTLQFIPNPGVCVSGAFDEFEIIGGGAQAFTLSGDTLNLNSQTYCINQSVTLSAAGLTGCSGCTFFWKDSDRADWRASDMTDTIVLVYDPIAEAMAAGGGYESFLLTENSFGFTYTNPCAAVQNTDTLYWTLTPSKLSLLQFIQDSEIGYCEFYSNSTTGEPVFGAPNQINGTPVTFNDPSGNNLVTPDGQFNLSGIATGSSHTFEFIDNRCGEATEFEVEVYPNSPDPTADLWPNLCMDSSTQDLDVAPFSRQDGVTVDYVGDNIMPGTQLLNLDVSPNTYTVQYQSTPVTDATCKTGSLNYTILDQLGSFSDTQLCEQGPAINLKDLTNGGFLPATGGEFIDLGDPTNPAFSGPESEMFNPSLLAPAVYNIQYMPPPDYDDCPLGDITFNVTIAPLVENPVQPAMANYCVQDNDPISLSQMFTDIGIVNNGTFSLDGPSTSIPVIEEFTPSSLAEGTYTSVYTPSDINNDCRTFALTFDITPAETNMAIARDTTTCQSESIDLRELVANESGTGRFEAEGNTISLDMGIIFIDALLFIGQTVDFEYIEEPDGCRAGVNIPFQITVEAADIDEVLPTSFIYCVDYGRVDLDSLFFTSQGRPIVDGQYILASTTGPSSMNEVITSKIFLPINYPNDSYEITFQATDGNNDNSCIELMANFEIERTQVFAGDPNSGQACSSSSLDLRQFLIGSFDQGSFESVIPGQVPVTANFLADFTDIPSSTYNFYHIVQGQAPCPGIPDTTEFIVDLTQIDTLVDLTTTVCEGANILDLVSAGTLCNGAECNAITGVADLSNIDVSGLTETDDFLLRLEYTPTTGNAAGCSDSVFVMVDIVAAGGAGLIVLPVEVCPNDLYDLTAHDILNPDLEWYSTYVEGDPASSVLIPNPSTADLSALPLVVAVKPSASGDCAQQTDVVITTLMSSSLDIANDITITTGQLYDLTSHDATPGLEWYETFIAEGDPGNVLVMNPSMADLSMLTQVTAFRPRDGGVCADFDVVPITVNAVVELGIDEPVTICRGESTDLTSLNGANGVTWYSIWIDQGNAMNVTIDDPTDVVLEAPVIAELITATGIDTQEITVIINENPILSFAIDGEPACDPTIDAYGIIVTVDPADAIPTEIGPITNLIPVVSGNIATYTVTGLNTSDGVFELIFADAVTGCTDTLEIQPPADCSIAGCVLPANPTFDLVGSSICSAADFPIDINITNADPDFIYIWEDDMGIEILRGTNLTQNDRAEFSIRVERIGDPMCTSGIIGMTGVTSFGEIALPPTDFSAGCDQDTFVYTLNTPGTVSVDFGNADGNFTETTPESYVIRFATDVQDNVRVAIVGDQNCDATVFTITAPSPCDVAAMCPSFPGPGNPNIDANPGGPYCDDSVRPVLRVSNNSDATNFHVVWYSGIDGIDSVGVGSEYTLPDEGVYTARFVNIVDGTCPPSRVSSFTYEITGMSDASFTIPDFCFGEPVPAVITGDMGGKFSFVNSPADGASIDEDTGEITSPSEDGVYEVRYTVNPTTCPGIMDQTVSVIAKPFISGLDIKPIGPNNDFYNVIFDTDGDVIEVFDVATGIQLLDLSTCTLPAPACNANSWIIDNIPIMTEIRIESSFSSNNCLQMRRITPPDLSSNCAGFGLFEITLDSTLYPICEGDLLPTLKVADLDSLTILQNNEDFALSFIFDTLKVYWYDQEVGGDTLHRGFTYRPAVADTFWAAMQIVDFAGPGVVNEICEYEPRTRVIVQELALPNADVIYDDYCEGQTFNLPVPVTPNGRFSITDAGTTASIDELTGELSNLTPGESYTIRYDIGARCQNFSEQVITYFPSLAPPTVNDVACDATEDFYFVNFTSSSIPSNPTLGDLVPGGGPDYVLQNIPKGEAVFIDVGAGGGCGFQTFELSSGIDCSADCIAPEFESGLGDLTYCIGDEPTLRVVDPGLASDQVIEWYFVDPNEPDSLVATGLEYTPTQQGQYFVLLTDNATCRSAPTPKQLIANAAPNPDFDYDPVYCDGDSFLPNTVAEPTAGRWEAVDAAGVAVATFNNSTGEFVAIPTGQYTISYISSFQTCLDTLEQTIEVVDRPTSLMDSDTTVIFNSATNQYTISFSSAENATATAGNLDETGGVFTLSDLNPGESGSITIVNANGCESDPFSFTLPPLGDCSVLPDMPIMPQPVYTTCAEGMAPTVMPIIPAGTTIQWYADRERMMPINTLLDFTPSDAGTYYAEALTADGCASEIDSFIYSFFPTPIISLADTSSVFDAASMTYTFTMVIGVGESIVVDPLGGIVEMSDAMDPQTVTLSNITPGIPFEITVLSDESCESAVLPVSLGTMASCTGVMVDMPTIDGNLIEPYCESDPIPIFTVNNVPTGGSINWYDDVSGVTPLETTDMFQPTMDGSYFAEAVDANGCVSSARLEVSTDEIPLPVIQDTLSFLDADGTYSFTIDVQGTVTSPIGMVTGVEPSWTITGIPAGTSMFTLTIDDGSGCPLDLVVNLADVSSACPAPPANPMILTDLTVPICDGDMFSILAESDPGTTIAWYDDENATVAVQTGPELVVTTSGTYYYEAILDTDCTSVRESIDIQFSSLPQILNNRIDAVCDIAVGGYGFTLDAPDAVNITTEGFGTVTGDGATGWTISGLPAGLSFILVAENADGCRTQRGVQTDAMSCVVCPADLEEPMLVDPTITEFPRCLNGPYPTIETTVPSGFTVEWFKDGALIGMGTSFTIDESELFGGLIKGVTTDGASCVSSDSLEVEIMLIQGEDARVGYVASNCEGDQIIPVIIGTPGGTFSFEDFPIGAEIDPRTGEITTQVQGSYSVNYMTPGATCPEDSTFNFDIYEDVEATFYNVVGFDNTAMTYGIEFGISPGGSIANSAGYAVDPIDNDTFRIRNIPIAESFDLVLELAGVFSCFDTIPVMNTIQCSTIPDPVVAAADVFQIFCPSDPVPELRARVQADQRVVWYNAESGGTILGEGVFTPERPDGNRNYYAEAVDMFGCVSNGRQIVTLSPLMPLLAGDDMTVTDQVCFRDTLILSDVIPMRNGVYDLEGFVGVIREDSLFTANLTPDLAYSIHYIVDDPDCGQDTAFIDFVLDDCRPSAVVSSITSSTNCHDTNDGSFSISVVQEQLDTYTFQWSPLSPPGRAQEIMIDPNTLMGTVTDLPGGRYVITSLDQGVAAASDTILVDSPLELGTQVREVSKIVCSGDADAVIRASTNGGTGPYSFEWNTGDMQDELRGVDEGTYSVTVTDANQCMSESDDLDVVDTDPIQFTVAFTEPLCPTFPDGEIIISDVQGGEGPFEYLLNGEAGLDESFNFLDIGTYGVSIRDSRGCLSNFSDSIRIMTYIDGKSIELPDQIFADPGETVQLPLVLNNISVVQIRWAGNGLDCIDCANPSFVMGEESQFFAVQVVDESGCVYEKRVTVVQTPDPSIYIPNAISLDPANSDNKFFFPYVSDDVTGSADIDIYDRWGNRVYSGSALDLREPASGWDGTLDSKDVAENVYAYVIRLSIEGRTNLIERRGTFLVIR